METFETRREFNNKFKSGLFVCPNCSALTKNKYVCPNCSYQTNGLFAKNFEFEIKEINEKDQTLIPLEVAALSLRTKYHKNLEGVLR